MSKTKLALLAAGLLLIAHSMPAQARASSLKLGIFADADSLPFTLCETENIFADEGVDVELIRFQSAVERDSAFQAGSVDGIISDVLAVLLSVQGGFPIKITSLTDGRYGIVAAPSSKATSLFDLAGQPIGISSNSVIHYMVDSFMTQAGVPPSAINLVPVPKMPVRMEMVLAGQTAAAGMPEPFLTMARVRGARLLASTDDYGLGAGVLAFSRNALSSKLGDISKLYKAYWRAAQKINASPETYRSLLVKKAGFSDEAAKAYVFVVYKKPRLPT
ncbi:MAG TPA: ABC transporter substrate-binding protein, partial [Rectinemataceae bacterium]|nr:ABC transporter substrate-binding protein [Rectinemataceae bacterium]